MADFRIRLNTEIDDSNARKQLNDLINDFSKEPIKLEVQGDVDKIKNLLTELKELKNVSDDIRIGGKGGDMGSTKALAEFKRLTNQYNQLQKQLAKETNVKSIEVLNNQIAKLDEKIGNVKSKLNPIEKSFADAFKADAVDKLEASLSKTFSNIEQKATSLGQKIETAFNNPNIDLAELDELSQKFRDLQDVVETFDMNDLTDGKSLNQMMTSVVDLETQLKDLVDTANSVKLEEKFDLDCTKSISQLTKLREEYESLGKDTSGIDNMINSVRELQDVAHSADLGELKNELNQINTQAVQMKSTMSGLKGAVSNTFSDFMGSLSAFTIGNVLGDAVTSGIYSLKDEILSLDDAMTNVIKVADEMDVNSAEKLQGITDNAVRIAKEVAGSVSDVTNSMAEAIKLGFSDMDVAQEIAKFSQVFANVGDMDISQATEGIALMLNAFQIDPLEKFQVSVNGVSKEVTGLEKAMDALNFAGNTQAIDVAGLTSAFQAGGSVLATYGMTLEETTALITSANNSIQDPTRVGNGLKSIAINLAGITTSVKDGSIEMNKTAKSLQEIAGIDVYADKKTGQIKTMTELLAEMQGKWKDLTEEEQLALSNAVAGKTQASVFQSLMQNYETYKDMMSSFNSGQQMGSAMAENAKYIDSISGKLAQLKATWTEIATTIFSSDMIKGALDGFNAFSEVIANIVKTIDQLGLGLPAMIASLTGFGKLFSSIKNTGGLISGFKDFGNSIGTFIKSASGIKTVSSATEAVGDVASSVAGEMAELAVETASVGKVGGGLKATLLGLGKIALPVAGVTALYLAWKKVNDIANEHADNYIEINDKIAETRNEIQTLQSAKTGLQPLAKEYDTLVSKTKLTNEELARFTELKKEIAQLNPELVAGYDAKGDPILALNGSLEDYIANLDTAIDRKNTLLQNQQNSMADEAGQDIYKYDTSGYNVYNDLKANQDVLKKTFEMNWAGTQLKDFETLCDNYAKAVQKRNDRISEINTDFQEKYAKFSEYELALQQKAFNKLSNDSTYKEFNNLNQQATESMNSLVSAFNWGNEAVASSVSEQTKFYKGFNEISKEIGSLGEEGSAKVDEWNKKLQDANYAYQQTGDIEQYRKSINGVCQELEKLTGIDASEWANGFTQQLDGSLDDSAMQLNEFLKSYGKSIEDLNNGDKYAIKLKATFEANTDFMNEIMQMDSIESAIDWVVKLNNGEIDYEGLSPQIRGLAQGLLDGADTMSEQEFTTMMSIVAQIQQHGDLSPESWTMVEKMMNGELTNEEIEMGITLPDGTQLDKDLVSLINRINAGKENNVEVGLKVVDKELESELSSILDGKGEEEIKVKITTALEGGNLDAFANAIESLPTEKQVDVIQTVYQNGSMNISQLATVLNQLPTETQVRVVQTLQQNGDLTSDELMALYNQLPPEVQKRINVTTNASATNEQLKQTNQLSGNKNKSVNTTAPGAQQTNSILQQINQKTYNKSQTVTTRDNGGSSTLGTLQSIANSVRNRVQTITTKFVQIGKQVWSGLSGGHSSYSTGGFNNVSETPSEISAQSEGFSGVSSTPTESSESSSSYSTSAINTVSTKSTSATEISTAYSKVWNSVKYGINMFQELENRIQKVQNSLKLLDSKMENAVGAKKISYLKQQIQLLKQEAKLQEQSYKKQEQAQKQLAKKVEQYGFNILKDGNVANYEETLRVLEKKAENAEEKAKKAQDRLSDYSGKSKSKKSTLEKSAESAEKASEKASKTLEDAKKAVSEYLDLHTSSIPEAQQAWQDLQNAIKEANDELEQLKFEGKYQKEDHAISELTSKYEQYSYYLDRARTRQDNLSGTEHINAIKDEIKQIERLIEVQRKLNSQYASKKQDYRTQLRKYDVEFDSNGQVTNYDEVLNSLKDNTDYDKVKNWLEEYIDLLGEARDGELNLIDLNYDLRDSNRALADAEFEMDIAPTVNAMTELNAELELYETLANNAAKAADRFAGEKRLYYLKKQQEYLSAQVSIYAQLAEQNRQLQSFYTARLESIGVTNFTGSNYADVLNGNLESEDLDLISSILEKYSQLEANNLSYSAGIEDVTSQMQDLEVEIKKATLATAVQKFSDRVTEATQNITELQNEIDLLSIKMQNAVGQEKLDYLEQQIGLWEELKNEQADALAGMQSKLAVYQSTLKQYGFTFDSDGSILNKGSGLSALADSEDYEYIQDTIELWEQLYNEDIPGAIQAMAEYENAITDAHDEVKDYYNEQLELTKSIEDKITSIYEEAIEERKKAIQDETDAVIKELNKQKKAYQDYRDEVDYDNDYAEKVAEVNELTKKLEIAKRDSSLSNKKNIQDLEKQLEQSKKELSELVQDRLDDTILDAYDTKIDELEENSEKLIEQLEEIWSDEKIADLVAQSLKMGVFVGLDGEVSDLENALISFGEASGEMFGVTGQIIKEEWVDNLQVALDTVKDLSNIMNKLEVESFNPAEYGASGNRLTTGDISINVQAQTDASAEDIAKEIHTAIQEALNGAIEGL